VPAYPVASNLGDAGPTGPAATRPSSSSDSTAEVREELRRLIIEELTAIIKG
jgi:hypothetical protein